MPVMVFFGLTKMWHLFGQRSTSTWDYRTSIGNERPLSRAYIPETGGIKITPESGRGLPQSKTLRVSRRIVIRVSVLDCARPLALFHSEVSGNQSARGLAQSKSFATRVTVLEHEARHVGAASLRLVCSI